VIPETSALSDLIGTLYDTALERALWPDVLEKLAEFVGGSAASIYCKNSTTGAVYHQFGVEPHYQQLYFSKYVRLDPTTAAHCLTGIGQLVSTVDFIPYCEFVETPFYREWGRPQGLADFLTTPLDKSADSVALFGVFRNEQHGARRRGDAPAGGPGCSSHSPCGSDRQCAGYQDGRSHGLHGSIG
jgi:hypothetical protein